MKGHHVGGFVTSSALLGMAVLLVVSAGSFCLIRVLLPHLAVGWALLIAYAASALILLVVILVRPYGREKRDAADPPKGASPP